MFYATMQSACLDGRFSILFIYNAVYPFTFATAKHYTDIVLEN